MAELNKIWSQVVELFSSLDGRELAVNLGLTLIVVTGTIVALGAFNKYLTRKTKHLAAGTVAKQVYLHRLASLILLFLKIALVVLGICLTAIVWGLDVAGWAASDAGKDILGGGLRLFLVIAAAVIGADLVRFLVSHGLEKLAADASDVRRAGQINTLAPLLHGLAQTAVVTVAALMILSEIGVKIGPLIAGAGVAGIAVGFGAQTLVKDFLTGLFLIVEDVVSVGDIVSIGDSGGLVEKMTLRTIQLRDFDGTLHVFPYSEAQVVHNLTKSFSYYVFNLQISYEADIDKALSVMRATGAEMQADPDFAEKILAPIEVVGVDGFADSGVKVKARIKTKPIEQWGVGREYNRRIKKAFDREGIQIPYPHVQLIVPARDKDAAAQQALASAELRERSVE